MTAVIIPMNMATTDSWRNLIFHKMIVLLITFLIAMRCEVRMYMIRIVTSTYAYTYRICIIN